MFFFITNIYYMLISDLLLLVRCHPLQSLLVALRHDILYCGVLVFCPALSCLHLLQLGRMRLFHADDDLLVSSAVGCNCLVKIPSVTQLCAGIAMRLSREPLPYNPQHQSDAELCAECAEYTSKN